MLRVFLPLRFVFMRAAIAPNLETASRAMIISGELVVNNATKSLDLTPSLARTRAKRLASTVELVNEIMDCHLQERTNLQLPITPCAALKPQGFILRIHSIKHSIESAINPCLMQSTLQSYPPAVVAP